MKNLLFVLACLGFWALQSCEDPTSVGENIIPNDDELLVDSIQFTDFIVNTIPDDSVYTSFKNQMVLGHIENSTFGSSEAKIYTEVGLFESVDTTIQSTTFISANLYLRTNGFKGNSTLPQNFEVYTLTDTIATDSSYIIGHEFTTNQLIGTINNALYTTDSITIGNQDYPLHIQAELDAAYAEPLFNKIQNRNITTNAELQQEVKGFSIQPEMNSTGQGLFSVNLSSTTDSRSGILFEFLDENNEEHTLFIAFAPYGTSVNEETDERLEGVYNHNFLKTDYTFGEPDITTQLQNYSTTGYGNGYVQSGNGLIAEVDFSNLLSQFSPSDKINVAELYVYPVINNLADTTYLPSNLILAESFATNDEGIKNGVLNRIDGNNLTLPDPDRIYDQTANAVLVRNGLGDYEYKFYMPNYLQQALDGAVDPKVYISLDSRSQDFNGIKFDVGTTTSDALKLDIKLTKTN